MPQEILSSLLGRIIESDPDASGDEHLLFFESKGRLLYLRHPRRNPGYVVLTSNALNQDSELVPAKARRCLRDARKPSDARRPL